MSAQFFGIKKVEKVEKVEPPKQKVVEVANTPPKPNYAMLNRTTNAYSVGFGLNLVEDFHKEALDHVNEKERAAAKEELINIYSRLEKVLNHLYKFSKHFAPKSYVVQRIEDTNSDFVDTISDLINDALLKKN